MYSFSQVVLAVQSKHKTTNSQYIDVSLDQVVALSSFQVHWFLKKHMKDKHCGKKLHETLRNAYLHNVNFEKRKSTTKMYVGMNRILAGSTNFDIWRKWSSKPSHDKWNGKSSSTELKQLLLARRQLSVEIDLGRFGWFHSCVNVDPVTGWHVRRTETLAAVLRRIDVGISAEENSTETTEETRLRWMGSHAKDRLNKVFFNKTP